jgi:hypothetical protein
MGIQQDQIKYYGKIWWKMNQDSDLPTLQKMNPPGRGHGGGGRGERSHYLQFDKKNLKTVTLQWLGWGSLAYL